MFSLLSLLVFCNDRKLRLPRLKEVTPTKTSDVSFHEVVVDV